MAEVESTLERWRTTLMTDEHPLPVLAVRDGRVVEANAAARSRFGRTCIGLPVGELCDVTARERFSRLLGERAAGYSPRPIDLVDRPSSVSNFLVLRSAAEELLLFVSADTGLTEAVAGDLLRTKEELATTSRELARARDAARQLRTELETLDRASGLIQESLAGAPRGDISTVLSMIALQAKSLTHADYVALGIGTEPTEPFRHWASLGVSASDARAIGRHPRPIGLLGQVARVGECLRLADLRTHPLYRGLPEHHPPMASFLGVPIYRRGQPVGNLYLANAPGEREFSDHDECLVRMLTGRVGAAIEATFLLASEASERVWLQSVINQMPGAVLVYDADGKLKTMNQALVALTCEEHGGADLFGNPLMVEWKTPEGRPLSPDELPAARVLRSQCSLVREEMLVRCRDGSHHPVLVDACPIRSDGEHVSGAIVLLQDIADRKKLERLRDEWTAIIAHDLRQPVSTISLAVEVALRTSGADVPKRVRTTLERISNASKRLGRMISDLLDASRIESNRLSLDTRVVALGPYLRSIVDDLHELTAPHAVKLTARDDTYVKIDPTRIHQVMTNLLSNAVKYGDPDADIVIEASPCSGWVELAVTNRGPGIAPEEIPLIFDRFARGKSDPGRRVEGLGLGLYISNGLVQAHGGRMWVDSVAGGTTTFHLTLPRGTQPQTEATNGANDDVLRNGADERHVPCCAPKRPVTNDNPADSAR